MSQKFLDYYNKIIFTVDLNKFQNIKNKYLTDENTDEGYILGKNSHKYLNFEKELKIKLQYAINFLNLDEKKELDILDISTGAGFFPFICQYFGHCVEVSDIPKNKSSTIQMYDEILDFLKIKKNYNFCIESNKKIPINDKKFDIVTALTTVFHKDWNILNNWEFFINDIIDNLLKEKKETLIFLHCNINSSLNFFIENYTKIQKKEIKTIQIFSNHIILIKVFKE